VLQSHHLPYIKDLNSERNVPATSKNLVKVPALNAIKKGLDYFNQAHACKNSHHGTERANTVRLS